MAGAETDILLRDGSTAHVRPIRPDDREAMRAFLAALSPEARQFRFFSGAVDVDGAAASAVAAEPPDSHGLVAVRGDNEIVAHALYARLDDEAAEVAFAVADSMRGHGIATTLLAHLAEAAEDAGISRLEAVMMPENHRMIEVFRESGFDARAHSLPGEIVIDLPVALTPDARLRFEERERIAEAESLRAFLQPRSIAVLGASRRRGTVGGEVIRNLAVGGFTGSLHAVNRRGEDVEDVKAYASVAEIPGSVDLAVVALPPQAVIDAARDCAAKGVRALVVLTAGFGESGPEGIERQRELVGLCRANGMRLVGPNCLGILNADPAVRMNATFAPSFPPFGGMGFLSQSGALGLAMIDYAGALGLGLSSFVSNGNKADVSGNDLLQYWEEDPQTTLIGLYLESFGNPRKFARIARRVAAKKPVLAVKSGRSVAGARGTSSHTGALISGSDLTVDALFRQAGVIRADTLPELLDVAKLLSAGAAPRGPRVGIVTNAGGLGILCADACEADGLEVPVLPDSLQDELRTFLPPTAGVSNPVDMIATSGAEEYRQTIAAMARSGAIDALVAIYIPPLVTSPEDVARGIRTGVDEAGGAVPSVAVFTSGAGAPEELGRGTVPLPVFAFPEDAARALARASAYGMWRERDHGTVPELDGVDPDRAAATISAALSDRPRWLEPGEVATLLDCYSIPTPAWRLVDGAAEAGAAAGELGGPVALKAVAEGLLHKTDVGAVELGLDGAAAVEEAARGMATAVERAGHRLTGFLVQRMVDPGVEMIVGVVHDPSFGPVVACGGGGVTAEAMRDVAVRITPLTDRDATEMIASLRTHALLSGWRGAPPADVAALENVVLRLAALVERHPEVVEADLNPVVVSPDGALVVDARVRVEAAPPRSPWPALGV